jgi:hypothetical protein
VPVERAEASTSLYKGATPRAGISPLGRVRPVAQDLLGVGLLVNAARKGVKPYRQACTLEDTLRGGVKPYIQACTLEDTLRGGVKPYIQAYTLEDTLRGEPSTESPAGAAGIMVSRGAG